MRNRFIYKRHVCIKFRSFVCWILTFDFVKFILSYFFRVDCNGNNTVPLLSVSYCVIPVLGDRNDLFFLTLQHHLVCIRRVNIHLVFVIGLNMDLL